MAGTEAGNPDAAQQHGESQVGAAMAALAVDHNVASAQGTEVQPAPPSQEKPVVAPRPMKKLKPAYMELSDLDNDADGFDLSPVAGPPGKAVTMLRNNPNAAAKAKTRAKAKEEEAEFEDVDLFHLVLLERARRETDLIEALPNREFTINESGKIELDEREQDGALARAARLDLPQDIDFEFLSSECFEKVSKTNTINSASKLGRYCDLILSPLVEEESEDDFGSEHEGEDKAVSTWKDWRQREVHLQFIKHELREQAKAGQFPANQRPVPPVLHDAAPTSPGGTSRGSATGAAGHDAEVFGTEPPPSPFIPRRKIILPEDEEGVTTTSTNAVYDRYINACNVVGCQAKPQVLKLMRALEDGATSMPIAWSHTAYLGNRGGQALFLALAANCDDIGIETGPLKGLRMLDLQGQGLGNEAACALASLLPRCPQLRGLNLARNQISETGAQKLMDEIQVHSSMELLNLDQNPVPSWLRVKMKELMASRVDDCWHDQSTRKMLKHLDFDVPAKELLRGTMSPTAAGQKYSLSNRTTLAVMQAKAENENRSPKRGSILVQPVQSMPVNSWRNTSVHS